MDNLPQLFHLQPTYETLSLTPLLLFIRPRTNQCPRLRPKAQYIILGSYPFNSPLKLQLFPSYLRRKSRVLIFKSLRPFISSIYTCENIALCAP